MSVCVCVSVLQLWWKRGSPTTLLTLTHEQPLEQQHRRCRRAGPGCGAAGEHNAEES
jgi:hypothetical protein